MKTLYILAERFSIDGPYCPEDADVDLGVFETLEDAEAAWTAYDNEHRSYGQKIIKTVILGKLYKGGVDEL